MPGGRGGGQLGSVPATQPTEMSPEGKVTGNGRKERMRRRNGSGVGVEMMGGIGIGKKDGKGSPKGGVGKMKKRSHV